MSAVYLLTIKVVLVSIIFPPFFSSSLFFFPSSKGLYFVHKWINLIATYFYFLLLSSSGGATGGLCSTDDFISVDQGSIDGVGPGDDRFCGNRLLDNNVVISRSKPFLLKIKSNHDQTLNAANSQQGFSLRYIQLPCVI